MRGDRLFVAVPLSAATRLALEHSLPSGLPGRRVPPEKWHFTLRFLGATAPSLRDRLIAELRHAPLVPSFTFRLEKFGAFPRPSRARVLWLGVTTGFDRFRTLAASVDAACARVGLSSDERQYAPHLTLSRVDPPRDLRGVLQRGERVALEATAAEVLLLRSHLGQGPSRYETLARYPLTPAA